MTTRVDEYLGLVDDPHRALQPGDPADSALLALLAHVAFSDGEVDDAELAFLARVLPGREPNALRGWAQAQAQRPLEVKVLLDALPTVEERYKGLRFAARMAWKDGTIAPEERELLEDLCDALELPPGSHERVLADMTGKGSAEVDPARLLDQFKKMQWDSVDWGEGPLQSELGRVVPEGAEPIVRIGLDGVEVLAFYREGIAGWFREGGAFLPWKDIVTFTRVPTIGAAVIVHDERGQKWTVADFRLSGLGMLLDRIFHGEARPTSPPPRVELVRGE